MIFLYNQLIYNTYTINIKYIAVLRQDMAT